MPTIDMTQFRFDLLAPELVLVAFGFIILLFGAFSRSSENRVYPGILAVLGLAISTVFAGRILAAGSSAAIFFDAMHIDAFSSFFKVVIGTAALIASLISIDYTRRADIEAYEYFALLLFAACGMMLLTSASDLISILVSIEIMSLSIYILVGIRRNDALASEASMKYFILGAFASAIIVYGTALLYGATKTITLSGIAAAFANHAILEPKLYYVGMGMILVGFAFKVASMPFHMWAPDVYQGAPAPITGFMAAGVKAAAFAAALRVFTTAFSANAADWKVIFWWLAVITMVGGNLMALRQENIKRMLAYSSIAHAGYLLIGLATGGPNVGGAMLFYLATYAFMTLGAFAVVTAVSGGEGERDNLADWSGIGFRHPVLSAAMAICLFSLAGIPPTAGFFAKFNLFYAVVQAGDVPVVVIAVLASCTSVYYYLRVLVYMYMREPERELAVATPNAGVLAGVLLTVAGVLYFGLLPGSLYDLAKSSFAALF